MSLTRYTGTRESWMAGKAAPGSWFEIPLGPHSMSYERTLRDGTRVMIEISCPLCARVMTLGHAIAMDGMCSPSLVCANKACTWHVFDRLDGWTDAASPQSGPL